ncbi:MAG: glucosaminidase domain-containing protein [Bacteroidota bacterium]
MIQNNTVAQLWNPVVLGHPFLNTFQLTRKMGLYLKLTIVGVFACTALFSNTKRINYIETYKYIAVKEMNRTGIPASIKLAQALLESGAGTSTLARTANNHFGIKCGGRWDGEKVYRKDDDYDSNGNLRQSCFRKYHSAAQSFEAHSAFLLNNRRYNSLFELKPTNYKAWAKGLRKAGYATNPKYARLLISIIERYELYQYDRMKAEDFKDLDLMLAQIESANAISEPRTRKISTTQKVKESTIQTTIRSVNAVKMTQATGKESIADIARRTNTPVQAIVRFNEEIKTASNQPAAGAHIFLQPKRNTYRATQRIHLVQQANETMYDIAQQYGIRLKKLYQRNRMQSPQQAAMGQSIVLRGTRTAPPKLRVSEKRKRPSRTSSTYSGEDTTYLDWEMASTAVKVPNRSAPARSNAKPQRTIQQNKEDRNDVNAQTVATRTMASTKRPAVATDEQKRIRLDDTTNVERPQPLVKPTANTDSYPSAPRPKLGNASQQERKNNLEHTSNAKYYQVSRGDTLYRIAQAHALSVETLKKWNGLKTSTIRIGQFLKIK